MSGSISPKFKITKHPESSQSVSNLESVFPGFESQTNGEIIFCDHDNLNTDGIYPGKYTYQDELTPEQMAKVVMENYDVNFSRTAKRV